MMSPMAQSDEATYKEIHVLDGLRHALLRDEEGPARFGAAGPSLSLIEDEDEEPCDNPTP